MLKKLIVILSIFISFPLFSQLHHQSLSAQSNTFLSPDLVVFQSIGQFSPIGNYSVNQKSIFQGFQQPLIKKTKIDIENKYNVVVFPNPFEKYLNFLFKNYNPKKVKISIYDLNGKLIREFKKDIIKNQLRLFLEDLKDSNYLINIAAPGYFYSTKIIKK